MVYTISATATASNAGEYRALIDGMPQMAIIHGGDAKKYYSFKSENVHTIRFTVTVAQGEVSLFMSDDGQTPSLNHHHFKKENVRQDALNGAKSIRISSPCSSCSYLMVVVAKSESIYSILAASELKSDAGGSSAGSTVESHTMLYTMIVVVVLIVVAVSAAYGYTNWKRRRALEEDLEIAE